MSKNKGWAKYYRSQWDNWVSEDKPYCKSSAWTYLWTNANHKDNEILVNGRAFVIRRGQHLTSIVKLAGKWGWSRKKVSNFLDDLEKTRMVTQNRTPLYTLITIVNYDQYQRGIGKKSSRGAAKEHQRNTNKKDKECIKNPLTEI